MTEKRFAGFSKGFLIAVVVVLGISVPLVWKLFTGFTPDAAKMFAAIEQQRIAKRETGIKELLPKAREGDARAQGALGMLYGQSEFIGANPSFGSYPSATNVKLADLKFWEGTQIDKNGEIVPGATHVGIYLGPGQWIAAQGNDKTGEVNVYSDTPYWTQRFKSYGSVLKY